MYLQLNQMFGTWWINYLRINLLLFKKKYLRINYPSYMVTEDAMLPIYVYHCKILHIMDMNHVVKSANTVKKFVRFFKLVLKNATNNLRTNWLISCHVVIQLKLKKRRVTRMIKSFHLKIWLWGSHGVVYILNSSDQSK